MLEEKLQNIGLPEKEARVYVSLLKLGTSSVSAIARASRVNRSSTYVLLSTLEKKGFVLSSLKKDVHCFTAISPEQVVKRLKEKFENHKKKVESTKEFLPRLEALYEQGRITPRVLFFEGKEGVVNVYEDVFRSGIREYRAFSSPTSTTKDIKEYFARHRKKRIDRKMRLKAIHPISKEIVEAMRRIADKEPFTQAALIPKEEYDFSSDIAIYGNRVAFVSPRNEIAVIIENQAISDIAREIFDMAFIEAKRLSKD